MNKEQFLLVKLAEECNEVAQMAIKSMQFGLDNVKPEQTLTNRERLFEELNDLSVIIGLLEEYGSLDWPMPTDEWIEKKVAKIEHFYKISKKLGKIK